MSFVTPAQPQRETLRRLLKDYAAPNRASIMLGGLFLAATGLCNPAIAWLFKPLVDKLTGPSPFYELRWVALTALALFVTRGATNLGSQYVLSRLGNRVIASVQRRAFDRLLDQGLGYFQDRHSSEFVARLALSASGVRDSLQLLLQSGVRDALQIVGQVALMFYFDPLLATVALVALPIAAGSIGRILKRVRKFARRSFDGSALTMQTMGEAVQGLRIVKAYNLEDSMRARMAASVRTVEKSGNGIAFGSGLANFVTDTLAGFVIAFAIFYGSYRITFLGGDRGSFIAFFAALLLSYEPAKRLGKFPVDMQNGLVNAGLIYEVIDAPPTEARKPGLPSLAVPRGHVAFDDVAFAYRPGENVIEGLTLAVEECATTALVGPSGGGKSTVLGLIQRFYAPNRGRVSIDGVDVAGVDLTSLRNSIAFVSQDVFLFKGTIRDNIALGKPGADAPAMLAAAKAAYAHDFIMEFPLGYDTPVGELGAQLSGGQRQRIAIARAILKNAPILLLDEPTAALDSESERAVQTALDKLRGGRTTIVVAHRLQTIVGADKIVVIEGGRAVESGTHAALIAHDGAYKRFFAAQFGASAMGG